MRTYTTIAPSLEGVLSDDHLYFEGIRRPSEIYKIKDDASTPSAHIDVLEKYFNDVYNLLLRKLSSFATFEYTTDEESMKLQALLQELIKVKGLIKGATEDNQKGENVM